MSRLSTKQRRARRRARPLRVFFDEYEWWVALDLEDARQQQRKATGMPLRELAPVEDWTECNLDRVFTYIDDEGGETKKPLREWAREHGRGLLGGTEW